MNTILELLTSGLGNLAAYLAAHVLLCLLPAFFIAGAMAALIPKEIVTRYLGRDRSKLISYPTSAAAGFLLAVCSCTVLPLFAGIYKKGAGIGPAITFLFVAPAVNILAFSYTGTILGMDLAIARLVLSLAFGIGIGLIMAQVFAKDDLEHDQETSAMFSGQGEMRRSSIVFLGLLVALLITGTFQIGVLKQTYFEWELPLASIHQLENYLGQLVPFDAAKGEEGVTAQGAMLIGLLLLIGLAAWKGVEKVFDGFNRWTWLFAGLVGLTLAFASLKIVPQPETLIVGLSGRFFCVSIITALLAWMLKSWLTEDEARDFLWESWRFVKQIFPILILGVFVVGMVRQLIQPEWVQGLAGENTIVGNFLGVVFGVFMYFPTLVEVPIAEMFLDLGMHRGPLLAYLISDPELSLQSILITASVIGKKKAWVYVGLVACFSTLAGLMYGAWINGSSIWGLLIYLVAILALVAFAMRMLHHRGSAKPDVETSLG